MFCYYYYISLVFLSRSACCSHIAPGWCRCCQSSIIVIFFKDVLVKQEIICDTFEAGVGTCFSFFFSRYIINCSSLIKTIIQIQSVSDFNATQRQQNQLQRCGRQTIPHVHQVISYSLIYFYLLFHCFSKVGKGNTYCFLIVSQKYKNVTQTHSDQLTFSAEYFYLFTYFYEKRTQNPPSFSSDTHLFANGVLKQGYLFIYLFFIYNIVIFKPPHLPLLYHACF